MYKVFIQYCEQYLDLSNSKSYINMQGIINFPYFIRVYKTAFFWKKIRFMKRRKLFLKERRGYLYSEKMKLYKQTIDLMEKEEEKVL